MSDSSGVRRIGQTDFSGLGGLVTSAGDINNDGIGDFLAVAPFEELGAAYVIFGSTSLDDTLSVGDLDGTNGFRIEPSLPTVIDGPFAFDFITIEPFGTGVGDFNGDGIDDFTIATKTLQSDANGGATTAQAYIIYGATSGFAAELNLDQIDGTNGVSLVGGVGELTGLSSGDINGDGLMDLALSVSPVPQVAGVEQEGVTGRAGYVVYGQTASPGGQILLDSLSATDGFAIAAPLSSLAIDQVTVGADDVSRTGIGFLGDIAGDSADDLGIRTFQIETTVDTLLLEDTVTLTSLGYVLEGSNSSDFGAVVDLDPDGTEIDWMGINFTDQDDGQPLVERVDSDQRFVGLGDLTGDGKAEFAIVDASTDIISIFYGDSSLDDPDLTLSYSGTGQFDGSVAALGDVNNDGVDDLGIAIGDYETNLGPADSVFVMLGRDLSTAAAFAPDIDLAALTAVNLGDFGYRIDSEVSASGVSVGGLGDVDGDGNLDIGIGLERDFVSDLALSPENNAGQVVVLFGGDTILEAVDEADGIDDNILNTVNLVINPNEPVEPVFLRVTNDGFISQSAPEGGSSDLTEYTFTIERFGNLTEIVTVDYNIGGAGANPANGLDFEIFSDLFGSVTFAAGETTKDISINVRGDERTEADELFSFSINNPVAPSGIPVTITAPQTFGEILNDDQAVDIRVFGVNGPEDAPSFSGQGPRFIIERSGNTESTVEIEYQINSGVISPAGGSDFFPELSIVEFLPGELVKTISVDVFADNAVEADESVQISLSDAPGSSTEINFIQSTANAFILNDDSPSFVVIGGPTVIVEGTFGAFFAEYTVFRFGGLNGDVSVDYEIRPESFGGFADPIENNDIFANTTGSVHFSSGQSFETIEVGIVGDTVIEGNEVFRVSLTDAQSFDGGADPTILINTVTTTIIDDDIFAPPTPFGFEADIFGDPHIVTIDGLGYDFQAVGEYTLLASDLVGDANPFEVQVRFEPLPGSELVSVTTRMAVSINGVTVEIDGLGEETLLIDGAAPTEADLALGAIDVDGDGTYDVFINSEIGEYTLVLNSFNEQLKVKALDGSINVCVFLSDDIGGGHAGAVAGLMGNANGDRDDDLAFRDGTVLTQPVEFDTLYGDYAESWALVNGTRLFSDVAPDFPDSFPVTKITVDDLPESLLAAAAEAVEAAGIDPDAEPIIFEAAVLDFALTSQTDFIEGAIALAAEPQAEAVPENAPELDLTVGVTSSVAELEEGDDTASDVTFTFYRLGPTDVALDVTYEITGVDSSEIGDAPLSGIASFSVGDDTSTLILQVNGDLMVEGDETLRIEITGVSDPEAMIASAFAQTVIIDDDAAPVASDDIFTGTDAAPITGNLFAPNPLGEDTDADGDVLSVASLILDGVSAGLDGAPFTLASGALLDVAPDGSFTYTADASLDEGDNITDTFSYAVTDGLGGFDEGEVMIAIMGINDAPILGDDVFEILEDTVLNASVVLNDSDPEGVGLIYAVSNGPSDGALTLTTTGAFVYAPDDDFAGIDSFAYTATDGTSTQTATVTITVEEDGDPALDDIFTGTPNDDAFNGGEGDDTFFLRFGDDTTSGGSGADAFIIDSTFVTDGDSHRITDLDFDEGDTLSVWFFDGTERTVTNAVELAALGAEPFASFEPDGTLVLTNSDNDTVRVSFGLEANVGVFGTTDLSSEISLHPTLAGALGVALPGQVVRVLNPVEIGDAGPVTIGVEDLTLLGDVPFTADFTLSAAVQDVTLLGSTVSDVTGNALDNAISGSDSDNLLQGLGGDDDLLGNNGNDTLQGGDGEDTLAGGNGTNRLEGGDDNDTYIIRSATDVIIEDATSVGGRDVVEAKVDYVLTEDQKIEVLLARAGGLTGLRLEGNKFRNDIRGNSADDTLLGGDGNDVLRGKGGENVLDGGNGRDRLYATAGENTLIGGKGDDIFYFRDADTVIVEAADQGRDTVLAQIDYTAAAGLSIEDIGTNLDTGGLTLVGNEFDQLMRSDGGGDTLDGGPGGKDTFRGKGGADTFVFGDGWGNDRIFDFEIGVDTIDMSGAGVTSLSDFDILRQVGNNTKIEEGDAVLILTGVTATALTEDDFIFAA